jgi:membrane protein
MTTLPGPDRTVTADEAPLPPPADGMTDESVGHRRRAIPAALRRRWVRVRAASLAARARAERRWPVVGLAVEVLRRWSRANGSVMAGHLAFRLFLTLVPAVLVAVAVLGYASSRGTDLRTATAEHLTLSRALADTIASSGEQASETRWQALLVGGSALLLAGLALVRALRVVFASVWSLPPEATGSLAGTFGTVLALLAVFALTGALNRRLGAAGILVGAAGVAVLVASGTGGVLALMWQLPRRARRLRGLLPGALVAGVGFAALNGGSAWYFTHRLEAQSQVYGAVGVTTTVLTYLFAWSELLVLGAVIDAVWMERREAGGSPDVGDATAAGPSDDP